ncbi:MAG: hypothetical protein ABSC06_34180 [Rhodopila sp.]|jgi:tetratricopeptide (TPR) repeat protein
MVLPGSMLGVMQLALRFGVGGFRWTGGAGGGRVRVEMEGAVTQESAADEWIRTAAYARETGNLDIAHSILSAADAKFAAHAGIMIDLAKVSGDRGDWAAAERIWERFVLAFPQAPWWAWPSLGECKYRQGDIFGAAESFSRAYARFPDEGAVFLVHTRALLSIGQTDAIPAVVAAALDAIPSWLDNDLVEMGRAVLSIGAVPFAIRCANKLMDSDDDGHVGRFKSHLKHTVAELDPALLRQIETPESVNCLMRFESLGGDAPGCEIGLVQRRFKAEPLGLLRWASTTPHALIEALRCGLNGVGTAEQTQLLMHHNGAPGTEDYKTRDTRFGMEMMTFTLVSSIEADEMRRRSTKRIEFLRQKLLEDLAQGEKIFVYRTFNDDLDIDGIRELKAAMSLHGHNRLLYVKLADPGRPPGTIAQITEDLIVGRVSRFSFRPNQELFLDGWLEMFTATATAWPGAFIAKPSLSQSCK